MQQTPAGRLCTAGLGCNRDLHNAGGNSQCSVTGLTRPLHTCCPYSKCWRASTEQPGMQKGTCAQQQTCAQEQQPASLTDLDSGWMPVSPFSSPDLYTEPVAASSSPLDAQPLAANSPAGTNSLPPAVRRSCTSSKSSCRRCFSMSRPLCSFSSCSILQQHTALVSQLGRLLLPPEAAI